VVFLAHYRIDMSLRFFRSGGGSGSSTETITLQLQQVAESGTVVTSVPMSPVEPHLHHTASLSLHLDRAFSAMQRSSRSNASQLRSSSLLKLQGKLLPWLRSLQAFAVALMKSKRIRTLLQDLQEEVLQPLVKLGLHPSEVVYLLRIAREVVSDLPPLAGRYEIEKEGRFPFPYDRKIRAQQAAAQQAKDEQRKRAATRLRQPSRPVPR
jgi:hypothetical protein